VSGLTQPALPRGVSPAVLPPLRTAGQLSL